VLGICHVYVPLVLISVTFAVHACAVHASPANKAATIFAAGLLIAMVALDHFVAELIFGAPEPKGVGTLVQNTPK
jgi:hypothetical protein